MKSCLHLVLAAFSILIASSGALAATESPAKTEPATKAKFVLEKGVEGENILKHYGKPFEINPMEAPDKETRVERWIYRRKVKESSTQTASGQTMVPTYAGFGGAGDASIRDVPVAEFRLKHTIVYQVTELLMINGKLHIAKQWMGQEEKYL